MISNDSLAKISGFWLFYRWHPQIALRYLPLVDEIKKLERDVTVLEVGSGGLGIAPYLKKKVTAVDIDFKPPFFPQLKMIKGDATKLEFDDNSFDVVVSVDMLEHVSKDKREKAVYQMIRVAKKKVLIGVPCGIEAERQDVLLDEYYKKKFRSGFPFLEEQIENKLPKKAEMNDIINKASKRARKKVNIKIKGNINLSLRLFLMKGWMSKNFLPNLFFRKILLFAIPFMRKINQEPTYRKLFFVDIKQ